MVRRGTAVDTRLDQHRTDELLRTLDEAAGESKMLKARIEHAQDVEVSARALGTRRGGREGRRDRSE